MNKLVVVFGLFGLTFCFGLGVTAVQLANGSFLFPFDSGGGFGLEELMNLDTDTEADLTLVKTEFENPAQFFEEEFSDLKNTGWTCGDGTLIDGTSTGNGDCDCTDCSDETVFRCSNGEFIAKEYLNDGECDCGDSCEDEG